jgi:PAS domain S-box-containing protein
LAEQKAGATAVTNPPPTPETSTQTATAPAEVPADDSQVIRTFRDYWKLSGRDQARPIDMELRVDFYDPLWHHLWVTANGEGGYIPASGPLPIRSRDRIRVEGTVVAKEGISAKLTKITILERDVRVTPVQAQATLGEPSLNNKIVTFSATFDREHVTEEDHLEAEFIAGGYRVHVFTWGNPPKPLGFKPGDIVRLTGVYNVTHDPLSATIEIDLWMVENADAVLRFAREEDPRFKRPVVSIGDLNQLYLEHMTMAHVVGRVRAYTPGRSVTLRDETGEVLVQTFQTLPLRIGDTIEAWGEPFTASADWLLRRGIIRQALPSVLQSLPAPDKSAARHLRLADQVLELSPKEAATGRPVEVMGVVVWAHPKASYLFLRDTSGTVRVQLPPEMTERPKMRSQLKATGVTEAGVFAPEIRLQSFEQSGIAIVPEARPITVDQAMTGLEEGHRVTISGHVQRLAHDGDWSVLTLTTQTGEFTFRAERDETLSDLIGSIVSVEGVCHALANSRRQLTGIEILGTKRADIRVEQPLPADPFDIPLREISALRQFSANGASNYWARVRGVVTYHLPGRVIFIQDERDGLMLLSEQKTELAPGDEIEAAGLPGLQDGRGVLREAVYRKLGRQSEPASVQIVRPSQIDEALDGRLVRISAGVISTMLDGESVKLALQSDDAVFTALLSRDRRSALELWKPGARLDLTGVYQVVRDERRQPRAFHLQLRSPLDVRVLQKPSVWTPGRAVAVTVSLIACIGLGVTWLVVLRRRVDRQTDLIRIQLLKEADLEAHNRAIVANASDVIFTTDLNGCFNSLNPAGERLLGYTRDEIMRMTLRDLVAPEDDSQRVAIVAALPELRQSAARFELRFVTRDRRRIWMEVSVCLVTQEGRELGVLGVARDIAERKLIEEELKRARDAAQANTEAKSAFLANMSHEIRTPMNGVIGMSNLLLDTRLSDDQHEYAQTIRNSAEALLTVLNDILDFSKIEAGKLDFEIQDFDLKKMAEETLELLASRATAKQIELTLFVPPELPRHLRGDAGRLRQVLVNLIGNALKFTDEGEVAVSVSLAGRKDGVVDLRFEVSDTGVGISPEAATRLFRPFSQADASTTRRFGGTGLGLAISKQIVELMHGTVGVQSQAGRGSTFWFTAQLEVQSGPVVELPEPTAELKDVRVLAVDDHSANRRVIAAYTAAWGMSCTSASSGEDALARLRSAAAEGRAFQLVLLDYHMPGMDGLALARAIRSDPQLQETRMVMLTSVDRRLSAVEMAEHGLQSVMTKPIHTDELLSTLRRVIAPASSPEPRNRLAQLVAAGANGSADDTRSLRVLVAEDNAVNQRLVLLQLQKLGYQPDFASSGSEVLKALEEKGYDVILMDCQMPEMDGYEATRAIRRDARFGAVRIIAMTANAMQGDRERCLEAGMDDYLAKPTRLAELRQALLR